MRRLTLMNVWKNTTLGDCDVTQEFVQFLVVSDGKLKMSWNDTCLLVVTSSVSSQLEDFSSQVFENCCKVDWSTSTNTLSIVSFSQESVNTTNWECKTSFG